MYGYLTSWQNLAGIGLALLGLALAMTDPIGLQGFVLVPVFYALGALAVRRESPIGRYGFDPRSVQAALAREINAVSGRVPPEVIVRIQRIELTIRTEILPRLDRLPLGSPELFLVERTASDYLPTAVDTYLRLPDGFASAQPGAYGRSALEVLVHELDLIDSEIRLVAETVRRADMDRLLAHERFLADRFAAHDPSSHAAG